MPSGARAAVFSWNTVAAVVKPHSSCNTGRGSSQRRRHNPFPSVAWTEERGYSKRKKKKMPPKVDAKRCQLLRHTDPSLGRGHAAVQSSAATIRLFCVVARLNFVARLCACVAPSLHLLRFLFFPRPRPPSSFSLCRRTRRTRTGGGGGRVHTRKGKRRTKKIGYHPRFDQRTDANTEERRCLRVRVC